MRFQTLQLSAKRGHVLPALPAGDASMSWRNPHGCSGIAIPCQCRGPTCLVNRRVCNMQHLKSLQVVRCRRKAFLEARCLRLQIPARLLAKLWPGLIRSRRPQAALHHVAAAAGHHDYSHQRQ